MLSLPVFPFLSRGPFSLLCLHCLGFAFFSPLWSAGSLSVVFPVSCLSWSVVQEDAYGNKVHRDERQETNTDRRTDREGGTPKGKKED